MAHKVDLYYLARTDQDAYLWIPAQGVPVLMVRKSLVRAKEDSPLERIVPLTGFSHLPGLIREKGGLLPKRVGLEMDILPARLYLTYKDLFAGTDFVDISPLIRSLRMVKSDYELGCIMRAAAMADRMYGRVPSFLEDADSEIELSSRVEGFYRSQGHPGFVRTRTFNMECLYGQVMSGKSGAAPSNSPGPTGGKGPGPFCSQGAGQEKIRPHEPIFIDHAGNVEGYIADQARIFSIGKLSEKFHTAHGVMLDIQDTIAQKGRPGVKTGDLYELALEMAKRAGLGKGFLGYPDPVPFVGHGVGLEIDEWPVIGRNSDTILEKGMVLAVEPKFVFPGQGIVGVENTFLVTEKGMNKLNSFPEGIFEC
jgi:Xaa-Pro aminopeptidase